MKKLFLAIALNCCYFLGTAQTTVTAEQAKAITANVMANFTERVSFVYTKGLTLEQFKTKLYGKAVPLLPGNSMIETAYDYLSKGVTKDRIIRENDGVAVANAFKYLSDQHKKGIEPDGTEVFGGKTNLQTAAVSKVAGCKWYQFWCLVEEFANWVVANWAVIQIILGYFGFP